MKKFIHRLAYPLRASVLAGTLGFALMLWVTAAPVFSGEQSPTLFQNWDSDGGFHVVVPIYNDAGLQRVRAELKGLLRPGDVFLLISGNYKEVDRRWLSNTAKTIKKEFPSVAVVAGTSGVGNILQMASGVESPIEGIVYIYEPNFPREPEFTWNFETTTRIFEWVGKAVHKRGFVFIGKPTGRPLLQTSLQRYRWNYCSLGATADFLFVQTQTYCKKGPSVFTRAVEKVMGQYEKAGKSAYKWIPQVTVDPEAPNGTSPANAAECARIAKDKGLRGVLMWWSPSYPKEAVEFLRLLGRTPEPAF